MQLPSFGLWITSDNDDNNKEEGSGNFGMYFKINGAVIYMRGANFIPIDQLEGRIIEESYRILLKSSIDANMNVLRMWGGGIYYPSIFYDTCDELGILIYHDLMHVSQENHDPTISIDTEIEIRNVIRDLYSYTCIVLWSGCNECYYDDNEKDNVYIDFVLSIASAEDNTRIIWPGSPSYYGWENGVHRSNGKPNGNKLKRRRNNDNNILEVHGPYMHGSSDTFMTVILREPVV